MRPIIRLLLLGGAAVAASLAAFSLMGEKKTKEEVETPFKVKKKVKEEPAEPKDEKPKEPA